MDAFFASVELLRRPELRGKPVIVATGTDPTARGVVMAASYEARKYGVHSAMPLQIAHRKCPQAVLVPRDMQLYREMSNQVMEILRDHSDLVEIAGLDEAYLDLSESPMPQSRGRKIKHRVKVETGLTCSVGLAPNKLIAKIASDLDKPDGFCVLPLERWLETVGERDATLIPGVGPKTRERLGSIGIKTVAQLAAADLAALERAFGPRQGESLLRRANGIDDRRVTVERERKSESRETTFSHDVDDPAVLREALDRLLDELCRSLASHDRGGRTVTLKIRLRPFRTYTRSRTLDQPTSDRELIGSTARKLLDDFEIDAPVRLLGVGVASMTGGDGEPEPDEPRELRLDLDANERS